MCRSARLFDVLQILRDARTHRAEDMAQALNVSTRTLYRDIDTLVASGVPIIGTRGAGYQIAPLTTLPPMSLTDAELEALNLGIAIVAQATDTELAAAATSLGDKLDALLPQDAPPTQDDWGFATSPFSDATRGFVHLPTLRSAIKARQKLHVSIRTTDGTLSDHTIRPLYLDYWGRVWSLTTWSETTDSFQTFRTDLIETATALPELFQDTDGKTLADFRTSHLHPR